jgi:hypothetical protein
MKWALDSGWLAALNNAIFAYPYPESGETQCQCRASAYKEPVSPTAGRFLVQFPWNVQPTLLGCREETMV